MREQMIDTMFKQCLLPATLTLLFYGAPAAAEPQALYIKSLAANCANCHGTFGKTSQDAALPSLAGMKSDYIVEQMQAFKSAARSATIMHQIAKGFSYEQIKSFAGYFPCQQP